MGENRRTWKGTGPGCALRDVIMAKTKNAMARMVLLAGFAAASSLAAAFIDDAKILIDRALNSPTLNVRFDGVAASMVELRVNGVSLGTRTVSNAKKNGETTFNLDLATLADGDNEVEVRLFDKNGKLVGSQKSTLTSDNPSALPVRLIAPKMGATVMGPLEIKVGFGREFRNSYVSFFVNDQFRSMTNTAPYSFLWDTTREPNGWHELEAWIVDETSSTYKTRKTKVFVNNPSGKTERRVLEPANVTPVPASAKPAVGTPANLKAAGGATTAAAPIITATPPRLSGVAVASTVPVVTSNASGLKPTKIENGISAGPKLITPGSVSAKAPATTPKSSKMEIKVSNPPATGGALTPIAKGTKLPNSGAFTIMLDAKPISFDVSPRVENGVPLTPIRHLLEAGGGEVNWENATKSVSAWAEGREIFVRIGDKVAKINNLPVEMEIAPFLEKGRTIVPLSFIRESLDVDIQYDPKTGHVLITSTKKN
jgi:hypothetical protein